MLHVLLVLSAACVALLAVLSDLIGWYVVPLALGYVVCLLPLWPHLRRH